MATNTPNTVFRVSKNKENPYVMLNKKFLSDENISWKAKGILTYILSKPDDWVVRINDLVKQSTDGRDSIYAGIKELKNNGYMQLIEYRKKGKVFTSEYIVFEEKQSEIIDKKIIHIDETIDNDGFQPLTENPETESPDTVKPLTENPEAEKPDTAEPDTEKPDYTNNDLLTNIDINNNLSHKKGAAEKQVSSKNLEGEMNPLFDKVNTFYKEQYNKELSIPNFLTLFTIYQDPQIINQAIKKAKDSGGGSINYIVSILNNWSELKIKDITALNKFINPKSKKTLPPQHNNFKQREYPDEYYDGLYENT